MKPTYSYTSLFAPLIFSTGFTSENKPSGEAIISGTKFTYPLIEKWIAEYVKINHS